MPVEDLARSDVVTAPPSASVAELAATMDAEDVGSVVITEGDTPRGIVTDRDLTVRVLAAERDPNTLRADDLMSTDLCMVERSAGFYRATELMAQHGVRRLPVCDRDGDLVGIITVDDLNELLADEHGELASVVRAQRPPY
ncbi:CBS domain-containing protein [Natranaeroarchaeum sulfidigenes]|uniref:CBS domain n=1 Tax=Natranaeroarchaeum sulfidigenes TaxID=2784880 RepID=A0A897MUB3_9EURY|nr:CBS domain-containing protein [Natranaeroarchaeum sulfidigenes]QSG04094.1 CBS domain [Natranaeroarchaeum sulfidigenes]